MIDMDNLWKISKDDSTHSAWVAWAALPALLRRIEELERRKDISVASDFSTEAFRKFSEVANRSPEGVA